MPISRIERPLTNQERETLLKAFPEPGPIARLLLFMAGAWLVLTLALGGVIWFFGHWVDAAFSIAAAVSLLVVGGVCQDVLRSRLSLHNRRQEILRKLATTSVFPVDRVEATRVVEVLTDEVACWVHDVGDGRLYAVWSATVDPIIGGHDWPNSLFEIVQIEGFERELPPLCGGQKLEPLEYVEFRWIMDRYLLDEDVFDGDLEHLIKMHRAGSADAGEGAA